MLVVQPTWIQELELQFVLANTVTVSFPNVCSHTDCPSTLPELQTFICEKNFQEIACILACPCDHLKTNHTNMSPRGYIGVRGVVLQSLVDIHDSYSDHCYLLLITGHHAQQKLQTNNCCLHPPLMCYHRTKMPKLSGGGWEGNSTAGRDSWSHVFSFFKDKNLHRSNEKSGTMQEF